MNAFSAATPVLEEGNASSKNVSKCPFAAAANSNSSAGRSEFVDNSRPDMCGEDATLYDQFGGDGKMSLFVEDFMEGIMADPELACHHQKFLDPDEMELLKEKLCSFFKYKLDGSKFYIGKPMPDVHRNLGISDEMFDQACVVFTTSLKKCKPKLKVMREFVKRIGGIRNEIVFPRVSDLQNVENDGSPSPSPGKEGSLFTWLGEEMGIRNIVDSMMEQANLNNCNLFM